ncbi:hypothetical protein ACKXGF_07455 [Alkalibacillus sp. S2W]|uniref:hypothetical protein n=1 Tax=Alkalibacillus sp. S2W TaxID=3386553 RepID=UPI00398CACC5
MKQIKPNYKPIKIDVPDHVIQMAKEEQKLFDKECNFNSTKKDVENQIESGYICEYAFIIYAQQNGYKVKHNRTFKQGNGFDVWIESEGKQIEVEIKSKQFYVNYAPKGNWNFPLYMKEWVKLFDYYQHNDKVPLFVAMGYNPKTKTVYLYGVTRPHLIREAWKSGDQNRAFHYFIGDLLGPKTPAKSDGIAIKFSEFYSFNDLYNLLNLKMPTL